MKKHGFTLIEVLGVIILLGILVLISVPTVNNVLKSNENKALKMIISNIESAAKNWAADNPAYLPESEGESINITLGYLKQGSYADKKIINPKTDKEISNATLIVITRKSNNYIFKVEIEDGDNNDDDLLLPKIILKGSLDMEIPMNKPYVEPGYYATSYNEDITSKVEVTFYKVENDNLKLVSSIDTTAISLYKIKYSVANAYGTETAFRNVKVLDGEKPVITVNGNTTNFTMSVKQGTKFIVPTATVTDNSGEVIKAEVLGTVNTGIMGTYTITYSATDSSLNKATLILTVKVIEPTYSEWLTASELTSAGYQTTDLLVQSADFYRERTISTSYHSYTAGPQTWGYPSCNSGCGSDRIWYSCISGQPCGDTGSAVATTNFYRSCINCPSTNYGSWSGYMMCSGTCPTNSGNKQYEKIKKYRYPTA